VETNPAPWIEALRHSHDRLRTVAGPLGLGQLQRPSYAPAWSIAQVLSHLGSQAEVFSLLLDAGLTGQDPPGRDTFGPIWQAWDAKSAQAQAGEALRADQAVTERFESLDAGQREQLRLKVFGMDLDTAGLARMRLGEHAIHTWDIAVVLDPAATVAPDAVALLIDALGQLVTRTAKPGGADGGGSVCDACRRRRRPRGSARGRHARRGLGPPGLRAPRPRSHTAYRDPPG
jgi:uncharacterized protein (TIGR03083 family)